VSVRTPLLLVASGRADQFGADSESLYSKTQFAPLEDGTDRLNELPAKPMAVRRSGVAAVNISERIDRLPASFPARNSKTYTSDTSGVNSGLALVVDESSDVEPAGRRISCQFQLDAVCGVVPKVRE